MDGKILLSAADVGRSYPVSSGTFWAVRHVSLSIPQGAFVILRGPSGSGKTTLLNMLGALDLPTEGKIILEDREINLMSDTDRTELRRLLEAHVQATGSAKGREILDRFKEYIPHFKKIIPTDYKEMMRLIAREEENGEDPETARLNAFRTFAGGM